LFQGLGKTAQAVRFGAHEYGNVGGYEISHETMIGVIAYQHDHAIQAQRVGHVADDPFQNRPSSKFSGGPAMKLTRMTASLDYSKGFEHPASPCTSPIRFPVKPLFSKAVPRVLLNVTF
jgi:hypothetical protein